MTERSSDQRLTKGDRCRTFLGDAPVGAVDNSPKDILQMPDRFSNVAHACDGHGNRVFVTTKSDASRALWVTRDPSCQR